MKSRICGRYEVKVIPSSSGHNDIYMESGEADSFQGEIESASLKD